MSIFFQNPQDYVGFLYSSANTFIFAATRWGNTNPTSTGDGEHRTKKMTENLKKDDCGPCEAYKMPLFSAGGIEPHTIPLFIAWDLLTFSL